MKKRITAAEINARDDVARLIRELREKNGMSISDLADEADLSVTHLYDLFKDCGDRFPSFNSMVRIFNALGLKEITIRW